MMYVKYPLSLRNVEDLLYERGIDICHETVRLWWNRFGPMFAAEIRRKRVQNMRAHTHWRWHLDEVYVKINGEMRYLWRAVDHEGEVLESYVTTTRDKAAAQASSRSDEAPRPASSRRHGRPAVLRRRHESDRQRRSPRGGPLAQQQGRELTPAVPTTRTGDGAISEDEDTPEIRRRARHDPQPPQSGTSPHQQRPLPRTTLSRLG